MNSVVEKSHKPKIGSLYCCTDPGQYLFLYPSFKIAHIAFIDGAWVWAATERSAVVVVGTTLYGRYTPVGGKTEPIFYVNPMEPFLLLQVYHRRRVIDADYWHVLVGEKVGWLAVSDLVKWSLVQSKVM